MACPPNTVTEGGCEKDGDCPTGQLCVNGECFSSRADASVMAACNSDAQCQAIDPELVCNPSGLCDLPAGGTPCTTTAECPIDQFCNSQSQVCVPLQTGFCREESQCAGQKCSAPAGGVGRCVECMTGTDCPSGNCLSNGTCAEDSGCSPACEAGYTCNLGQCVPVAGDCNPPCLSSEQCVQGVCYGENGCPRNAHPVGDQCACDDGFVPNPAGNACVPQGADGGPACDPATQQSCQQQGGTWDAVNCVCLSGGDCDPPCPAGTACQGDVCVPVTGACTTDIDCLASGALFMVCDTAANVCTCDALMGFILCGLSGMAFDPQICDCDWSSIEDPDAGVPDAARPDTSTGVDTAAGVDAGVEDAAGRDAAGPADAGVGPDAGDDICAQSNYYGDGECDVFCPLPDPDCLGQTGYDCVVDQDCSADTWSTPFCYDGFPGGYCSAACVYNEDCDFGSWCICVDQGFLGCNEAYCYRACYEDDHCRDGYECVLMEDHLIAEPEYVCVPQ